MKTIVSFQHKSKKWKKKFITFPTRKMARDFMKRAKRKFEVTIASANAQPKIHS